jgi:OOP family OmpA-OmpF porin
MKAPSLVFIIAILLAAGFAAAQQPKDIEGSKDPALFTRMPHFHIRAYEEQQFDAADFTVRKGTREETQRIEGHKVHYEYEFDTSAGTPPSPLQIQRNYQNATLKIGGKVLYAQNFDYFTTTLLVAREGKETWVEISCRGGDLYLLTMVERQLMQQDVVANADALKSGLAENGHAEVPGIFFDFNKADIKPESRPALQEVVKLLQGSPALRVWVVGHTDNVGAVEFNASLSRERAAAVVKALVQSGIDSKRLTPYGNGPYAPVATNTTEEGRARNRRVELVAQQ